MQEQISAIIENDMPNIVSLLNLLAEHPAISGSSTLTGSLSVIKTQVIDAWDKLESAAA